MVRYYLGLDVHKLRTHYCWWTRMAALWTRGASPAKMSPGW